MCMQGTCLDQKQSFLFLHVMVCKGSKGCYACSKVKQDQGQLHRLLVRVRSRLVVRTANAPLLSQWLLHALGCESGCEMFLSIHNMGMYKRQEVSART